MHPEPGGGGRRRPRGRRRRQARSTPSRRSRGSAPRRRPGGPRAAGRARRRSPGRARPARAGSAGRAAPARPRAVPGMAPSRSRRPLSTSQSASSPMTTAPISRSLWPPRYLVAECTTMSAPSVERLLEQRSGERVVDDDRGARLVGRRGDGGDVAELERRVGRRLEPDERDVVVHRLDEAVGVLGVDQRGRDPAAGLEVGQLEQRPVVGDPRRDHGRSVGDQVEHGGDRRQPGRERQRAAALQVAERGLEGLPRGVAGRGRTRGRRRRRTSTPW